jgi:hypothetical protein
LEVGESSDALKSELAGELSSRYEKVVMKEFNDTHVLRVYKTPVN